jgi:hypothetical protein
MTSPSVEEDRRVHLARDADAPIATARRIVATTAREWSDAAPPRSGSCSAHPGAASTASAVVADASTSPSVDEDGLHAARADVEAEKKGSATYRTPRRSSIVN